MNSLTIYAKLSQIKSFREQRAAAAVSRQRAIVEHRAARLADQRLQHDGFRRQRLTRERDLFAELQGMTVSPRTIERMNQRVALLREQEAELAASVMEAERSLDEAKQSLSQARTNHVEAARELEKLNRLTDIARRSAGLARERREEREIEEIANAAYVRGPGRMHRSRTANHRGYDRRALFGRDLHRRA